MVEPLYCKIHSRNRILLVKQEVVGEVDTQQAMELERVAKNYRRHRRSYQIDGKNYPDDSVQRTVAGLILHFSDFEEFLPARVLIWAAFAEEDLDLKRVQSALCGKALKPVVTKIGRGYWKADEAALKRYFRAT